MVDYNFSVQVCKKLERSNKYDLSFSVKKREECDTNPWQFDEKKDATNVSSRLEVMSKNVIYEKVNSWLYDTKTVSIWRTFEKKLRKLLRVKRNVVLS